MKYGHFDDDNKEYVIQRPDTPYPWINYLGNEEFFSIISNTAGGYCFYKDARLRRITRYRYNNIPIDSNGKYFYINDNGQVWNPGWQPTRTTLDEYECRHGMGYTKIKGQKNHLCAEVLSFVPLGLNGEVQKLKLKNKSKVKKSFTVYSFVEWCFWNAMDDMTNFQRNLSLGEVETEGSVLYHKTEYKERRNHYAFYSVNSKIDGYDTDREAFLGMYNGTDRPDAVFKNKSSNSNAHGWSPVASHSIKMSLEPGEEKELVFVLGYVENAEGEKWQEPGVINKTKAKEMASRFDKPAKADAALEQLRSHWRELFSHYQVKTHDPKLDRMVNVWNQYQCMITFNMSRSASYFESGIGRGMGFRDSNQDMIGSVHQAPGRARARILDAAATQFEDGGAYHQYQPLTKNGNDEIGSNFNDDPLWLILSVTEYIKETGDYEILDEMVPFDNDQGKVASLFEHLKRSFYYTVNHLGPHKLPLIGQADWNDCLNLNCFSDNPDESFQTTSNKTDGTAESVFIAAMFVLYGSEFARLCQKTVYAKEMIKIQKHIADMREAINLYGWDGDWFLRAYDYFGEKVGSNTCQEGKIFVEPQGICVMAGIGLGDGKAQKALDSVKKYLDCDYGIVLNNPAFTKYHKNLGEISTYPQGYKENASVFCHNNPWVVIAETMIGRGERAFEYYRKISPSYLEDIAELHRTEPYVYAQMIAGKDAHKPGEAKNSWLTGTAAWNFYAISQYILGIKPDYDGLLIEPCIPAEWDGFTVIRKFRGAEYHIEVLNPEHISKGVQQLIVDGEEIKGNLIPVYESGSVHKVEVTMGSHRPAKKGHTKIKIKDVKPRIKAVPRPGEIPEDEVLNRD